MITLPPDSPVTVLKYARPDIEKPSRSIYRTVIVLGSAPMVLGGLALLLFWALRWRWGPDTTALMFVIGIGLLVVAAVQLILFGLRERRYKRLTQGQLQLRSALAGLLLVSNIPVLWLYQSAPQKLTRNTTVTVINNGSWTIDCFVVKNSGVNTDIGPVAPGATVKGSFNLPMGQYLSYEAWQIRVNSRSMSGGSLPGRKGDHTITMTNSGMTIK